MLMIGFTTANSQHNALMIKDKQSRKYKIIKQQQKIQFWKKNYPHLKMRGRLQEITDTVIVVDGTHFPIHDIEKIAKSRPGLTVLKVVGAAGTCFFLFLAGVGVLVVAGGFNAPVGLMLIAGGTLVSGVSAAPLFVPNKKYKSEKWEFLPYQLPLK